jgi:uncharacterized membrane protein YfcA
MTGVLSGAFGVGGAVISTPAIRALGVPADVSIGTTLPSIFPSAVTGTLRYAREGLIDWRVVALTAPAGMVAAVGGSLLSKVIPGDGHWLMVVTALLLAFTSYRMGRQTRRRVAAAPGPAPTGPAESDIEVAPDHEPSGQPDTRLPVMVAIGTGAGLMSGLLGIGGGVVMVPGFTEIARIPLKQAIATSLACVGMFAIPGTITHALLGDIDWRVAFTLTIGVVPGARLGAALAIRSSTQRLRLAVAVFLGLISVIYLVGELAAL